MSTNGSGRQILSQEQIELRGMAFRLVRERIAPTVQWDRLEPHHLFVIHRTGQLRLRRTEPGAEGRAEAVLRPGDVWLTPALQPCRAVLRGDSIEFVEVIVPQRALGDLAVRPLIAGSDTFLHETVNRIFSSRSDGGTTTRLLRDSLAESVRLHLRDRYAVGPDGRTGTRPRLNAHHRALIARYLDAELSSEITLDSLAELCEMRVPPFVAAFTTAFGHTPYQYVLNRRIEAARRLLATSDQSIAAIGAAVGFSTPSHFASTFRQRVGVTPSEYRAESTR